MVGHCLVSPHVLPHRFTDLHYRDFLLHGLPEHVPLAVRAPMWYMHDSVPAHFNSAVRDVLSKTHNDRRIGREGSTAWLPRSPDLDLYLWEHLNILMYAVPVDNEEALHHRILDTCYSINNYAGIFEWMRRSLMRRVEASTYYKCTLSAITHKLFPDTC
jgi:hypothetical protein